MAFSEDEKASQSQPILVSYPNTTLSKERVEFDDPSLNVRPSVSGTTNFGSHNDDSASDDLVASTLGQHETDIERVESEKRRTIIVPRSRRRGLFARFSLVPEVTEPTDYSNRLKWFITFIVALAAAAAPVGSAILLPTLDQIIVEFDSSQTIVNLSVALYMLSMALFPLWWSSFSETSGRRTVYLVSFAMYILFSALSAESKNIPMLIVMRMLSGGAAASVQAVGAGTIADMWETRERGKAMSTFYLGPLCGPLFAPIVGGALGQRLGWRATQWAQVVYGALVWVCIFFLLPETLKSLKNLSEDENVAPTDRPPLTRTSTRQSVQQKSVKWVKIVKRMFIDPLGVIGYLRYPPVLLTVYYASVTFGSLYVLNISIQYTFEKPPYEFSTIILGLLYLPNSLGYILASLLGGKWLDHIMKREATKANRISADGKLIFLPEDRMRENAWLGGLLYPCALVSYGWLTENGVFWLVPMLANFFYGVGSMLIFAMVTTQLTEYMPRRSSSGVALNNLMRNIFSCAGAIVGAPAISAIGNGWFLTILGLWALASGLAIIWAMKRHGDRWRRQMDAHMT